jgi:hypothetical protein
MTATPHDPPCERRPLRARALAAILVDIANRLERLAPSHKGPEAFHIERSELVAALRRIAGEGRR